MNNEIEPKKTRIVNEKTLLITVDIGKVTNMGYYRCPDGTEIKPFEFFNTGRGFNEFWRCISKASTAHNLRDIVVGFESTGPYAEALMHYLRKREVKLVQVNPMHTKRLKELQGNSNCRWWVIIIVAHQEVLEKAMTPEIYPTNDFSGQEVFYRDTFDYFLTYLERINHFIDIHLIATKDVSILKYWLKQIFNSPHVNGRPIFTKFLKSFNYDGIFALADKLGVKSN